MVSVALVGLVAGQLAFAACTEQAAPSEPSGAATPAGQPLAPPTAGRVGPNPRPGDVPIGAVIDWWRPNATLPIPDGFLVADGRLVLDPRSPLRGAVLPDLRGRFVRGVQDTLEIGSSGGASTHMHAATPPASYTSYESHRHVWSHIDLNPDGKRVWSSHNRQGDWTIMTIWNNGIGNEGA